MPWGNPLFELLDFQRDFLLVHCVVSPLYFVTWLNVAIDINPFGDSCRKSA